ncbi:hypothetical protein E4T42_00770 [Aureobasidium subglaciale]|uniref:Calcofluor white hypersensitive protein n=1 Tax=Aureobasidium subglaciale (strain EXF-2481) TaxID=1043005 RepID=A0A074Y3Q8_AURSE|nr:uncharacterized protein AUEXF2481DRAFT_7522 [Aureobasidium subglaciale EXF-2481]KAI5210778.1 hypothetical protein E4T38_01844 [Aureobasidium subglaciale]KAI5229236.1 hypothetical protein E4T40_01635 [Aureobasidium subglaciale]KAI5232981.1 hypothetical protein E4T41_01842 [Aureobasidium subglaciale]KAI5257982.1 hypothetical protein E4T42_00770 [Aureobasidium subglaciale]KAI5266260.1 hypothetical protein E4T46_01632 [Aureobasidium subglaciale]
MAARSRLPLIAGLGAATFGGYYMYRAGGSPKVAEKQMEADAARLSSSVKNELPGKAKELKTDAKVYGEQIGQKIDSAVKDARDKTREFDAKFETYRADAEKNIDQYKNKANKEFNSAVDTFDKKVGDAAANAKASVEVNAEKAKSGFSSWFGSSK